MKIGFVGLGNVGAKLAGSLIRNKKDLTVMDLDVSKVAELEAAGAKSCQTGKEMAQVCDYIITCLPSPAASQAVMQGPYGILEGLRPGTIWAEMSTTDAGVLADLAKEVTAKGGTAIDCPVSGGCHRAATGNISIFAGCDRETFERALPVLTVLGRRVLHTGELGSASLLKVMTNYLATVNLISCAEALTTMKAAGVDLGVTYEAIRISSGTSFVHETESQVILNGSRDINFTMDLVNKDIGLFQKIAEAHNVPLEISPLINEIFQDGQTRFGPRAFSPSIIRRLEEPTGLDVTYPGFPADLLDDEPEEPGYEVRRAT